jgi:hypothetical protein
MKEHFTQSPWLMVPASSIWCEAAAFALLAYAARCISFSSSRSAGFYPPLRIALNRIRRRRQKGVKPLLYHSGDVSTIWFVNYVLSNFICFLVA